MVAFPAIISMKYRYRDRIHLSTHSNEEIDLHPTENGEEEVQVPASKGNIESGIRQVLSDPKKKDEFSRFLISGKIQNYYSSSFCFDIYRNRIFN